MQDEQFYEQLLYDVLQDGRNTISIRNEQAIGLHMFVTNADIITHLKVHLGKEKRTKLYKYKDGNDNEYWTYDEVKQ